MSPFLGQRLAEGIKARLGIRKRVDWHMETRKNGKGKRSRGQSRGCDHVNGKRD